MNRLTEKNQRQKILGDIYAVAFQILCLSANIIGLFFLAVLLFNVFSDGIEYINFNFLSEYPSRFPAKAGILSALVGTILIMILTAIFSIPMGIGAAIYMEEYAKNSRFIKFVKINIQNLASVPSIIYGILGLTLFVRGLSLERSLLSGALTISLLILPIITITAQESLKAIPNSLREAAYGVGMTRWQVIYYHLMPIALPGMTTGIILALSRAIGEAAPLIMIGGLTFVAFLPASILDSFTVLPIQIFNWTARPQKDFHNIAAAAIIVLLCILLLMNATAIYLRIRYKNKMKKAGL